MTFEKSNRMLEFAVSAVDDPAMAVPGDAFGGSAIHDAGQIVSDRSPRHLRHICRFQQHVWPIDPLKELVEARQRIPGDGWLSQRGAPRP
jgi:hypothetical protein